MNKIFTVCESAPDTDNGYILHYFSTKEKAIIFRTKIKKRITVDPNKWSFGIGEIDIDEL